MKLSIIDDESEAIAPENRMPLWTVTMDFDGVGRAVTFKKDASPKDVAVALRTLADIVEPIIIPPPKPG